MATTPSQRGTQHRKIRLDDATWEELGTRAGELGSDRSAILRQLAEWWLRRPDARMPTRPVRDA